MTSRGCATLGRSCVQDWWSAPPRLYRSRRHQLEGRSIALLLWRISSHRARLHVNRELNIFASSRRLRWLRGIAQFHRRSGLAVHEDRLLPRPRGMPKGWRLIAAMLAILNTAPRTGRSDERPERLRGFENIHCRHQVPQATEAGYVIVKNRKQRAWPYGTRISGFRRQVADLSCAYDFRRGKLAVGLKYRVQHGADPFSELILKPPKEGKKDR